jgi:type II secretory pathway pseudopilin PulG
VIDFAKKARPGFTILEALLTFAVLGVMAGITVVAPIRYIALARLNTMTEQTVEALRRAQILARAGAEGSAWGFDVPHGTLFKGVSMALRDIAYDESYPVPESVEATGLTEVSFAPVTGLPSGTGTIVLTSIYGDRRFVVIAVSAYGTVAIQTNHFTICHHPGQPDEQTMTINEQDWLDHRGHGDVPGGCLLTGTIASASSAASSLSSLSMPMPTRSCNFPRQSV